MPPVLDPSLVERLAKLADKIDGARPEDSEERISEFNRRATAAVVGVAFRLAP
jgi:predicted transcriptional regulator